MAAKEDTTTKFLGPDNEWKAPDSNAVRSNCPAINALANHGLIDRSGKNIDMEDIKEQLSTVFNAVPAISEKVGGGAVAAGLTDDVNGKPHLTIDRLYTTDKQEHDASFTRLDDFFGEASKPVNMDLVNELVGGDKEFVTKADIMEFQKKRILSSRKDNPDHKFTEANIGSMASQATFILAFGLDPDLEKVPTTWLKEWLGEERLPSGYNPTSSHASDTFPVSFSPDAKAGKVREEFLAAITEAINQPLD